VAQLEELQCSDERELRQLTDQHHQSSDLLDAKQVITNSVFFESI